MNNAAHIGAPATTKPPEQEVNEAVRAAREANALYVLFEERHKIRRIGDFTLVPRDLQNSAAIAKQRQRLVTDAKGKTERANFLLELNAKEG